MVGIDRFYVEKKRCRKNEKVVFKNDRFINIKNDRFLVLVRRFANEDRLFLILTIVNNLDFDNNCC